METKILLIGEFEDEFVKSTRCTLCATTSCADTTTSAPSIRRANNVEQAFGTATIGEDLTAVILSLKAFVETEVSQISAFAEIYPEVPLVLVLARCELDISRQGIDLGVDEFLFHDDINFWDTFRSSLDIFKLKKVRANKIILERDAQIERDKAMAEMLVHTAHEIRTPLTIIQGFADALSQKKLSAELNELYLNPILTNTKHLLSLSENLLDWCQGEAGELGLCLARTKVSELFSEIEQSFSESATAKNLSFQLVQASSLPEEILTDQTRLKQILFNLIANAIKFTADGGVHVFASFDNTQQILRVEIVDTGMGIAEEHQKKLFDPVSDAHKKTAQSFAGFGVGLSISNRLAKMLGGSISCISTAGHGSTFRLDIQTKALKTKQNPTVDPTVNPTVNPKVEIEGKSTLLSGHVVVAEDSVEISRLLTGYCNSRGLSVTYVRDGLRAVTSVITLKPDLLILDSRLPGLSGLDVLRQVRELGFEGKVVSFSAATEDSERKIYRDLGCQEFLEKPFSIAQLETLLVKLLPQEDKLADTTFHYPDENGSTHNDTLHQVIKQFVRGLPEQTAELEDAARSLNYSRLSMLAHRLRSAHNFGYPAIGELARALETAANVGEKSSVDAVLNELSHRVSEIISSQSAAIH